MLSAKRVTEVLKQCLYPDGTETPPDDAKIVEGVIHNYGFDPVRLEKYRSEISTMLSELPDEFKKDSGGGMSFLNACMTKDGTHWGEHRDIEQLLVLGIATDQAKILMPRKMWGMLPGGMPYFVIC